MPLINHAKKEINAKLIYFGPPTGGKATNLQYVYSKLKESTRGVFKSMDLQGDRMFFFDFMPSGQGNINGYNIRFHIYTLTGAVHNPASWKMLLKGVDGLIFVADSTPGSMSGNVDSFKALNASLARYGKILGEIPCVIQCNKQDLPQALAPVVIERDLAPLDSPLFPAIAVKGEGVLESIFALIKLVLRDIRAAGIEMEEQQSHGKTFVEPEREVFHGATQAAGEMRVEGADTNHVISEPIIALQSLAKRSSADPGYPSHDEPLVEVVGGPEILEGGVVQLPLAIRYGGKVKLMKLNISLSPSPD